MKPKIALVRAGRPLNETPPQYAAIGWPLGFNPGMDQHAAASGAARHWSCVSPGSNEYWMRRDGEVCRATFRAAGGYLEDLRAFDRACPIGKAQPVFAGRRKIAR